MKIASWNVAGLRARLPLMEKWLARGDIDIICLQEIKTQGRDFPYEFFADHGYHSTIFGQKAFNGVAIIAKQSPIELIAQKNFITDEQARFLGASFQHKKGLLNIHCLYAPNGNPVTSDKFSYKIEWFKRFYQFAKKQYQLEEQTIFAGDFNIIPQKEDAKIFNQWEKDALFYPYFRHIFRQLLAMGYEDAIKLLEDQKTYSFWDFQGNCFKKDNGIRIDHFLLSPQAADLLDTAYIERHMRGQERPSDHAPVIIELATSF